MTLLRCCTQQNLHPTAKSYEYNASFLEIYNEKIRDLLCDDSASSKLDIKQGKGKDSIMVSGLTILPVTDTDGVSTLLSKANSNRAMAATQMNANSSRCVLCSLYISLVGSRHACLTLYRKDCTQKIHTCVCTRLQMSK